MWASDGAAGREGRWISHRAASHLWMTDPLISRADDGPGGHLLSPLLPPVGTEYPMVDVNGHEIPQTRSW